MDPGAQTFWRIVTVVIILAVAGFEGFLKWRRIQQPAPAKGKRSLKKKDPRPAFYFGLLVIATFVILLVIYLASQIPF
jgi:hypothetical protein